VEIDVQLDPQHLERLTAAAPLTGVTELIWNALDADAENIEVALIENELGGIQEIRVSDDGHGMIFEEATETFGKLGGSWKPLAKVSKTKGRALHGKDGYGRFRAAGIGGRMQWKTIAKDPEDDSRNLALTITMEIGELAHVEISDSEETTDPTGTRVVIEGITETPAGLGGEGPVETLTAQFGLALQNHSAHLTYARQEIDPEELQVNRDDYTIPVANGDDALLTVIEWKRKVNRGLFLCDENATPLSEQQPRIHAAGFHFTAYVSWTGFSDDPDLVVADMGHGETKAVLDAAREQLRQHFQDRANEKTREQIEEWKEEKTYPWQGEPETRAEEAARDVFDVVALAASDVVNSSNESGRRLSLRLLRESLESDPGSLHHVLQEVLDLPQDRLDELSDLLERTSLTALIATSKEIANRLEFIRGLEELVMPGDLAKAIKERSQLHKILENETWVFGEEYALTASDEGLTKVLEKHVAILGRDELVEGEVLDHEGKRRIVDLMLARSVEQNTNRREHLVVELKAPTVAVGDDEAAQIRKYATTVSKDPRFNTVDVQWDFVVVSTKVIGSPDEERRSPDRPKGLLANNRGVRVWVKTWAEILEASNHRLKFVKDRLGYQPDEKQALEYLRKTHDKYLPPDVAGGDVPASDEVSNAV
jgi:Histidine kinase-, DNA gyrase B-, and HSP90-like ATPase